MKFIELANTFERMRSTTKTNEKVSIAAEFLRQSGGEGVIFLTALPFTKVDPRKMGVGDSAIKNAIVEATGNPEKMVIDSMKKTGTLAETTEEMMAAHKQMTFAEQVELSIVEVTGIFDKLAEAGGAGSNTVRQNLIAQTLREMTPQEGKYFIGLLSGQMPSGTNAGDGITERAIAEVTGTDSKLVKRVHAVTGDIRATYNFARHGDNEILKNVGIRLFTPFDPILAEAPKGGFETVLTGKVFYADKKYDGFRMLIHKRGTRVRIYSRNLEDKTDGFPEICEEICATFEGHDVVVDGECIGVSQEGRAIPFQNISTRIQRKDGGSNILVKVKLFDILYLDGNSFMDTPYRERRDTLSNIYRENGTIELAEYIVSGDIEEIKKFSELSKSEGNEGLILKDPDGLVELGERIHYKVKGILDTIDCAVYAADHGTGKRKSGFGSFYIGCRGADGNIMPLGKVATGFKQKEGVGGVTLTWMTEQLQPCVVREEGAMVFFGKNPVVIVVACEEIQISPTGGLSLRFPRVADVRTDKEPDTEERVRSIYDSQTRHK